jgi:hypothetical protein
MTGLQSASNTACFILFEKLISRPNNMYISEILQYLIWPGFILLAWISVKFVLSAYEKKYPEED